MFWNSGHHDPQGNVEIVVGTLEAAIAKCEDNGWGYDLTLPHFKWHVKKNYADNFKFKGHPTPDVEYD